MRCIKRMRLNEPKRQRDPWAPLSSFCLVPADTALEARLAAAQRQLQLADRADALLGQAVSGAVGRDAVAVRDLVDAREIVVDRPHHAHGALAVVAVELE